MAVIRMTHPEHGYNIVYNSAEQQSSEKLGWKVITEAEFKKVLAAKNGEPEAEASVEAPKKRGPKPKAE